MTRSLGQVVGLWHIVTVSSCPLVQLLVSFVLVRVKKGNAQLSMVKATEARWKTYGEVLPDNGVVSKRGKREEDA